MSKRGTAACLVGLCLSTFTTALEAQSVLRLGSEFQVNTYTSSEQLYAKVARDADGDFVVAWTSFRDGAINTDVFGQRYASSGAPLGAEFLVNSYTPGFQGRPSVARDDSGDFVIVWPSLDGGSYGVFGRRFDASGTPLAQEFLVNTYTPGFQSEPRVDLDADGDFVVVWDSDYQDGDGRGVFGQRFGSNGGRVGAEFQVNTAITGSQQRPDLGLDADGDLVVVWGGPDESDYGVFARRFTSAGVGGAVSRVNTFTLNSQRDAQVSIDSDGDFVVAWTSGSQDDVVETGVFAQRFNQLGMPVGAEFQVNTYTLGYQHFATLASDDDGDFVIAWQSVAQDGSEDGVFARLFEADGTPNGGEFQINSYTSLDQTRPEVGVDGDGDFVIAWESLEQDGNLRGIFAQRLTPTKVLDVDGNGSVAALTDGLLVLRFLFGFTGTTLTNGAVAGDCSRCNAGAILPYLQGLV